MLQLKLITALIRLLLNGVIIFAIFYNQDLMLSICGPFTLPPLERTHLLKLIIPLEILRVGYSLLLHLLPKISAIQSIKSLCSLKYILLLILKTAIFLE